MADTIQIKYNGTWRELQRLRLEFKKGTDPSGFAGPRTVWLSMSYDVPSGEEPEESQYAPMFQTTADTLPASTIMFDAAAASAVDIDNWSDGGYARVRAFGVGDWSVSCRFMATLTGDTERQLKADVLDGDLSYKGVPFPSVETHEFRIRTRRSP